jgi:4-amino-4-deoxy-L-arabinose transferase-like glycosyltransferase
VAETNGLLNRRTGKSGTEGSNPSVSATVFAPLAHGSNILLAAALGAVGLAALAVFGVGQAERFSAVGLTLLGGWIVAMILLLRGGAAARIDWRALVAAVALSLLLRFWSAELTRGVALGADPMNYTNLARAVIEGRGLVTDDWQYGDGLRAYFPPLYPLILAGFWSIFGSSAFATLALHSAMDLIAAWALADAGKRLGQPVAGRVAGAAYFAWPAFALSAGIPQKESLTVLLIVLLLRGAAIWLQAAPEEARRWRHGLWIGLWWGLLALTQASLVLAPLIVALALAAQRGLAPVLRLGLSAAPAVLLVMAPWWLRNWLLFGQFVPFTTASGMMRNAALAGLRVPFPSGLFDLPEPERSAVMARLANQAILANPWGALAEGVRSLALGFAYEEAPLARFRHTTPPIGALEHARLAPLLQGSWVLLLGSATGRCLWLARKGLSDPVVIWTCLLLLSVGVINIWFEFGERHRLMLTPLLLLLAAGWWLRGNKRAIAPR